MKNAAQLRVLFGRRGRSAVDAEIVKKSAKKAVRSGQNDRLGVLGSSRGARFSP